MSRFSKITSHLAPDAAPLAAPAYVETVKPEAPRKPVKPAKLVVSQHPDWERMHPFARKASRMAAFRRFQDAGGKEESILIEGLLAAYAEGKLDVPTSYSA